MLPLAQDIVFVSTVVVGFVVVLRMLRAVLERYERKRPGTGGIRHGR